ncbi:MAG TPA: peptidase inhibitor family I36 protein [Micromonosporaceae bacterium]|nr:peptidase inhibitor family I36 protein [Micromonosporaceae bacterium]
MRNKHPSTMVAAVVAAIVAMLVTAAPANAATHKNGVVESGEFGLYYLQNRGGYAFDLLIEDNNFSNDVFPGTQISANDNTESYWNRDIYWWHVYTDASYGGSHGCLPSGHIGDASPTFQNTISSAKPSSSSC